MNDITYCASKSCAEQGRCQRHISNNELKDKIYSVSDFTPIGDDCEFLIDDVKKEKNILKCEYCGEDSYNEGLGEIELTKDNLHFPQHYYNFNNGKDVTYEWIDEQVRKGLEYLENNPTEDFIELGTGNTNICITKYEGDEEYRVVVSKGYYDANIPIENLK